MKGCEIFISKKNKITYHFRIFLRCFALNRIRDWFENRTSDNDEVMINRDGL